MIADFVRSKYPPQIERLAIGCSSFVFGRELDYRNVVAKLGTVCFPELKILKIGIWELFHNSHCLYGELGDITDIIANCPKLECLELYGMFTLSKTIHFTNLKILSITLEDYTAGSNGGLISQCTLTNFLASEFPSLTARIDLNCDENQNEFVLPDLFIHGTNMPALELLEISGGFKHGEKYAWENCCHLKKRASKSILTIWREHDSGHSMKIVMKSQLF